jgi:hypothetical protein
MFRVLLHEVMHGILFEYASAQSLGDIPKKTEEQICDAVANTFQRLLVKDKK